MNEKPIIRKISERPQETSICGFRKSLILAEDNLGTSIHHLRINKMKPHFHFKTTEFYYILKGEGVLKLDNEETTVEPGTIIAIPPGVVHELIGDVEVLVIGTPPFRPEDQYHSSEKE